MSKRLSYVGVDAHERESQAAVFGKDGSLVEEKKLRTKGLSSYLLSLPGRRLWP